MEVKPHHFHLSTEIDVIVTDAAELVLWSKRENRVLVAFSPTAAEKVVLDMFEKWPTALELLMVKAKGYRLKVETQGDTQQKRPPGTGQPRSRKKKPDAE